MAQLAGRSFIGQVCVPRTLLVAGGAVLLLLTACKSPVETSKSAQASAANPPDLSSQLAAAQTDAAAEKLNQKRPDQALALLVSALNADIASSEARSQAETILKQTRWNLLDLTINHPLPIEQVAFTSPSSLWISLGPKSNTTLRWNLQALKIESILFPRTDCETRSLVFDPRHQFVVIERGGVNLLCNARTLKPVTDLGRLPQNLTPSAVMVFSEDGLLMAHPACISETDHSIVWHLRDTNTGQIIRSSEPLSPTGPQPLAAYLDRVRLQVLQANGTLLEIPVSPVEPITSTPLEEPATLLHAQFSLDGNAVLTIRDQGPHQAPLQSLLSYGDEDDGSLTIEALANRFPWSKQPNLWNSLMREASNNAFRIDETTLTFATAAQAPIIASQPITAASFYSAGVFAGQKDGTLTFHRFLPLPAQKNKETKKPNITRESLAELEKLCQALGALRFDELTRTFLPLTPTARKLAMENCDRTKISEIFPSLDFTGVLHAFQKSQIRTPEPSAFEQLLDRLRQSTVLTDLSAELLELESTFRTADHAAVLTTIQNAGKKGATAANALTLALKSENPEWIVGCLNQAEDLPPLLRQISLSRVAWLQGRKADALSPWPEIFPELAFIRLREDWHGWEQADFQPALDNIRQCVRGELDAIEVPKNSTPEQRLAIAARLKDRATLAAVGPRRFSEACLKAALAFSAFKEETKTTFELASLARNMGAPPEPCLRAEALALTGSGDSINAHPRWIELITEHPVATHLPGDYAEAAYTAFENSDPRQAMEILTTGMHRFPKDGNFALRAGWVALLTGNSERAYRFLREGQRIGFPEEKLENGTALLTIAAALTGAEDDAAVYFQDLLKIDQAWADPATLETLDWPEELKSVLGQFTLGL